MFKLVVLANCFSSCIHDVLVATPRNMNNQTKTIATIAVIAIFAAIGIVASVAVQTIVIPQQAFADPPRGNSFGNCHSFGPGHSDDACR